MQHGWHFCTLKLAHIPHLCFFLGKWHLSSTMAIQVYPFACVPTMITMQHASRNGERAWCTVGAHSLQHKNSFGAEARAEVVQKHAYNMLSKMYTYRCDSAAHKAFTEVPRGAKSPIKLIPHCHGGALLFTQKIAVIMHECNPR